MVGEFGGVSSVALFGEYLRLKEREGIEADDGVVRICSGKRCTITMSITTRREKGRLRMRNS